MSKKRYIGLNDSEVIRSREKYGVNVLTPAEKTPLWKQFLENTECFKNQEHFLKIQK